MWTPFIYAAVLILAFSGYLYLCERESRAGKRFVLAMPRRAIDAVIERVTLSVERALRYVVRYIITLSWYYSLHAFLKLMLKSIAGLYHTIEAILIRNRDRARALRKERRAETSHLAEIAEHKASVKLSPAEERKRKEKALKG